LSGRPDSGTVARYVTAKFWNGCTLLDGQISLRLHAGLRYCMERSQYSTRPPASWRTVASWPRPAESQTATSTARPAVA